MRAPTLSSALKYAWRAQTIYDVHAPRAFSFLGEVVEDQRHFYAYDWIEELRSTYLANQQQIELQDYGAGSLATDANTKSVANIARYSATPARFGRYLAATVDWLSARTVIELGTNLGVGTAYLASALPQNSRLISIDADPSLLAHARDAVEVCAPFADVELVEGTFVKTLPAALTKLGSIDLAFIDGHHAEAATKNYFEQILAYCHQTSVLILDDIHWSPGMEAAWEWVKAHPRVAFTIDLFRWGVVFLSPQTPSPHKHLVISPWRWKPWHMGFFHS